MPKRPGPTRPAGSTRRPPDESVRFRPAVIARMCVVIVAFLSYVVLVLKFDAGYAQTADGWTATSNAFLS